MSEAQTTALTAALQDRWGRLPAGTHRNVKLALERRGLVAKDRSYNFRLTGAGAIQALDLIEATH